VTKKVEGAEKGAVNGSYLAPGRSLLYGDLYNFTGPVEASMSINCGRFELYRRNPVRKLNYFAFDELTRRGRMASCGS